MSPCLKCAAPLEAGARFCAGCGARVDAADAVGCPLRLEVNRNRLYMKGHRGFVEFRVTEVARQGPVLAKLLLESTPAGALDSDGEGAARLGPGTTRVTRIPVLPHSSGELLFKLTLTCDAGRQRSVYRSEEQFLKAYAPTASAQHLAISIDNSVSSSGDMSGVSTRTQSELGRHVQDLVRSGATINELLDRSFPDDWQVVELIVDEEDYAALDLDTALGLVQLPPDPDETLRRALWETLIDGEVTAEEKQRLDRLIREHRIPAARANALSREMRLQVEQAREQLRQDFTRGAGGDEQSLAYLKQVAPDRLPEWKRLAQLGMTHACELLGDCYYHAFGVSQDFAESVQYYRRAADSGSTSSRFALAFMYKRGLGVPQDLALAAKLYEAMAEANDLRAMTALGEAYELGEGVPCNGEQAAAWYRKAADAGDAIGMLYLARLHEAGEAIPKNEAEAFALYRKSADAGSIYAMYDLGQMYEQGRATDVDYAEAMKLYLKAAEGGHDDAMHAIGLMHGHGRGVPPSPVKALEWYERAAAAGHVLSMHFVGRMYEDFNGIVKDEAKAMNGYRQAAEAGHVPSMLRLAAIFEAKASDTGASAQAFAWHLKAAEGGGVHAMYCVGCSYGNGDGVDCDADEAFKWYERAGSAGHAAAMYGVGWAYDNGDGVEQDSEKAFEWYRRAADAGDTDGMFCVGWAFEQGDGVEEDQAKAYEWYRKAAEAGNASAMRFLGLMYADGRGGVQKDHGQAVAWLQKAIDGGDLEALKLLPPNSASAPAEHARPAAAKEPPEAAAQVVPRPVTPADREAVLRDISARMSALTGAGGAQAWLREMAPARLADWRRCADAGMAEAWLLLGDCYAEPAGVEQDLSRSFEYYRKAADAGNASAMGCLGIIYLNGRGVARHDTTAAAWLRRGAEAGAPVSMRLLGELYAFGRGVPYDFDLAVSWIQKAAAAGNAPAKEWLTQRALGSVTVRTAPSGTPQTVTIYKAIFTVGRDTSADILVPHASVSRKHCEFRKQSTGGWRVVDLQSRNGTRVNVAGGNLITVDALEGYFFHSSCKVLLGVVGESPMLEVTLRQQ